MSSPTPPADAAPQSPRSPARLVILTVVGLVLVVWLARFTYDILCYEETDDAYFAGHIHDVSPQEDGTIIEVPVHDNQVVAKGDILVKLDPLEFQIAREKALAAIDNAQAGRAHARAEGARAGASLAQAEARRGQANAQVAQAVAQASLTRTNRDRARKLFADGGAVTQSDLDNAESADAAAHAAEAAAKANAKAEEANEEAARAAIAAASAQSLAADAALSASKAALKDAERQLAYATLRAMASGRIGNKNAEVGNRVRAGQTLAALVEPEVWVVGNFKETQLGRMHPGMPVEVSIDSLSGKTVEGTIESISPASGAQFALLPADNATGNFTKVVQRVPVRITLNPDSLKGLEAAIRPGLSVVVSVKVR